jgi:phosphoenolpyruvate phosphomutase
LKESGVREVSVVRGWRKEAVVAAGVSLVDNDRFAETGEVASLALAADALQGEAVIAYGDVLFRSYILDSLLASHADVVLAVDALNLPAARAARSERDLVAADRPYSGDYLDDAPAHLVAVGPDWSLPGRAVGEWMGLVRLSPRGAGWVREEIAALRTEGLLDTADMPLLLTRLAAKHPVRVKYFTGHWVNVETLRDLADARDFA